jgi:hypothetical protein
MLEKESAFYEAHKAELRQQYAGKRVVIADNQILGIYGSTVKRMMRRSKHGRVSRL